MQKSHGEAVMRALVIDDSRPIRGIIAKIMRGLNFDTIEAGNGREGWEILSEQGPFDIVTVNWEMPEMDGMQFASKVRRTMRFRHMPMLMISSIDDAESIGSAKKRGVDDYLVKPCTPGAITKKLKSMGVIDPSTATPLDIFGSKVKQDSKSKSESIERPNGPLAEMKQGPSSVPQKTLGRSSLKVSPSSEQKGDIRVLMVEDSSFVRNVIKSTLDSIEGFCVVGGAVDGVEGLELIESLQPDVVLLDIEMPRMDGLEMLREMRKLGLRLPVVMFSSRTERGAKATTDALLIGAKDFVFKPGGPRMSDLEAGESAIRNELAPRLKWICDRERAKISKTLSKTDPKKEGTPLTAALMKPIDLVVIAASTGGPAALASVLRCEALRETLRKPVVIVQHMPAIFTKYLASRLAEETGLDIAEATEGETLKPGMIRIAPGGNHLVVNRTLKEYTTSINRADPVNSCRPSADVLFHSAADAVSGGVLAVMMTGMGHDGRDGCRAIREAGGVVIAQDELTSIVWGMPGSVVAEGLANHVMGLEQIGNKISSYLKVGA